MSASWLAARVIILALAFASPAVVADDDVERAFAAARIKAEAGDVVAQFSLGSMIYYGANDTAQALSWFQRAAAQGYAPAEFQMGQLYDFGFAVAADERVALEWYRKAAGHGSAAGHRAVGEFYQKGRGVAADAAEAARWYRRGADGDDVRAQNELGQMYFSGTGVARDYEAAYLWFSVAAGQAPLLDNRQGLLELRNIAAARMTPAAAAAAARRAAAWKPASR
jgi:TPR repeat protein